MSEHLLTTRLFRPTSHSLLVPRPLLFSRLNEGKQDKLILVSAPAGFGKTTLLSTWTKQTEYPVAWLSLDEADNTPSVFLTYLTAALQTIDPGIGESLLPALLSPQPPAPQAVLTRLITDLTSRAEMLLVLDDYHLITSHAVHDILTDLIQHMPPNLHLVLATRSDPPLPLPRLRGRQQLTELRTADLRFSLEETDQFLNHIKTLRISDQDVAALTLRTEGWITGLQMAVLSMQNRTDIHQFIESFTGSNRYILDYLLEEVLQQQPEEIRTFLLKTSILTKLSSGLCAAVTGMQNCQHMLEELERANLFLIPLDDHRGWFRYHHLFADLLRQRLSLKAADSIPALHMQASRWYEENSELGPAIEHALSAEAYNDLIRLLKQYIQSIWEHGDQTRLSKWLAALPQDIILDHPVILVHHAFALCFAGQYQEAEAQLLTVEETIGANHEPFSSMASTVRSFNSLYRGEIQAADNYANTALAHLPADQHMWRTLTLSIQGDIHAYYGHFPVCENIWGNALREAEIADCLFFALWISSKLIVARKRMGKLHQAAKTFEQQTRRAKEKGYTKVSFPGALYTVWSNVLLEWNQVEEAITIMEQGLSLSESQNYSAGIAWSGLSLIAARFAQQGPAGAEQAVHQLEEQLHRHKLPEWTMNYLTAWKARISIARGDLTKCERILQERGIVFDGKFGFPSEVEYLALAHLLIAKDELSNAWALLVRLQEQLESMGWTDKLIQVKLLQTLILQKQGNDEEALNLIESILPMAEREGYLRVFLDEGPPMAKTALQSHASQHRAGIYQQTADCFPPGRTPTTPCRLSNQLDRTPQPARAGRSEANRQRRQQSGNRCRPAYRPRHSQEPPKEYLRQAGRSQPHPGHQLRQRPGIAGLILLQFAPSRRLG